MLRRFNNDPNNTPLLLLFAETPQAIDEVFLEVRSEMEQHLNAFKNTMGEDRFLNFAGGWRTKEDFQQSQGPALSEILYDTFSGYPTLIFRPEYHSIRKKLVVRGDFWGLGLESTKVSDTLLDIPFDAKNVTEDEKLRAFELLNVTLTAVTAMIGDAYHFFEYNRPPMAAKLANPE